MEKICRVPGHDFALSLVKLDQPFNFLPEGRSVDTIFFE
jgi:hypothetical protein